MVSEKMMGQRGKKDGAIIIPAGCKASLTGHQVIKTFKCHCDNS